ncbi:MAG: HD domain-containing protein [Oscillospiraceae bacterium]|nr:HD domain-containing protein [Oscillospiraceae bacterium]
MTPLPQSLLTLLQTLEKAGHEAYAVGGCVRDLLRRTVPQDYDVATSALPEETMSLFPAAVATGLRHGTVTVKIGPDAYEVTTFRTEGGYADHRHPDAVRFTGRIEDDLARRDFTVNAMALSADGRLMDPFGGQEDLRKGVLRCVGDADARFSEDALRIMRCLRFASRLGFAVAEDTEKAMLRRREDLRFIAPERLRQEMTGLLLGDHACGVLLRYPEIPAVFLPEILPCVGFPQRIPRHRYDVWGHIAHAVAAAPKTEVLRWTMLLHDLGKPLCCTEDDDGRTHFYGHMEISAAIARQRLTALRFDKASLERIVTLVSVHDKAFPLTDSGLCRLLHDMGPEAAEQLIAVKRADAAAKVPDPRRVQELDEAEELLQAVLASGRPWQVGHLAVNGADLTALGLRGPAVGEALRALLDRVMDGALPNEKSALLDAAQRMKCAAFS